MNHMPHYYIVRCAEFHTFRVENAKRRALAPTDEHVVVIVKSTCAPPALGLPTDRAAHR